MTDLVAPSWMAMKGADASEYWHAATMRGGLIASVVAECDVDGIWTARTQLRNRSFAPVGEWRRCGPFGTHEAALHAGQAAALRLHNVLVGMHEVSMPTRSITVPIDGFRSQALRRFVRVQQRLLTAPSPTAVPQQASEAEMMA